MSCRIYEEDDVYRIELDGEEVADGVEADELGDEIAELLEAGDLEPEDVVTIIEWDGSTRRRRAIAMLSTEQRHGLGYAIGAQPINGRVQSDLDEE